MKRYSAFLKAPVLLKPQHQIVECHIRTFTGGVVPFCRDVVSVFYSACPLEKLDFEKETDHLIPARRPDQVLIYKKKKNMSANFTIPVDHKVKMKESENINKYLDITRELRRLWNTMVTVVLIVVGARRTFPKNLEKD